MKTLKIVAAAALMVAATIIGAASAQDQPQQQDSWNGWMMGMWGAHGMMGDGGPGSWMMGRRDVNQAMCNVMANHRSPWNAYAGAARDNANGMRAHCATMMNRRSALSLPDRLEQHEQLMAAQLDAIRAMNKALKPLYAALSENQRKTADQLFWGPMGMM